jgi:hypothetical protein
MKKPGALPFAGHPRQLVRLGLAVGELMAKPSFYGKKLAAMADILEIRAYPEPAWLPKNKGRAFHFSVGFAEESFSDALSEIGQYLPGSLMFSADLGPASITRQGILPLSKILSIKELEKKIEEALTLSRNYYSGPIGAENYNYYPTGLYERICDPKFISRLLKKFGLFLVLDLAHALVSAYNLKTPVLDYLGQLPLDRVAEIHLSRPHIPTQKNALAVDAHFPPGKREWRLLRWLLARLPKPWPLLVVECYQSPQILFEAYEGLLLAIKPLTKKNGASSRGEKPKSLFI